jgi:hypothetical protein
VEYDALDTAVGGSFLGAGGFTLNLRRPKKGQRSRKKEAVGWWQNDFVRFDGRLDGDGVGKMTKWRDEEGKEKRRHTKK